MNAERVIKGLECCAREDIGDCDNCPYESINGPHCDIEMMRDALALLKAQEPTKFQIKTTISNVDIPKDVDEEQFFAVLSQQYAALAKLYGEELPTYSPS